MYKNITNDASLPERLIFARFLWSADHPLVEKRYLIGSFCGLKGRLAGTIAAGVDWAGIPEQNMLIAILCGAGFFPDPYFNYNNSLPGVSIDSGAKTLSQVDLN